MRRKKRKELEAQQAAAADTAGVDVVPADEARLTPVDVQQVEFRLAFRGYSEQDVDAFLDRISEELARLYEENKRLREEVEELPGAGAGPLIEDAQRRAEAIVREAREQAARLIEDPEQAAALAGAAGGGEAAAEAVRAFLGREREFLQSIASVIQRHAEAVKEDVRRAKEEAEGWTPAPSPAAVPAAPPAPVAPPPPVEPVGSAVSTVATAGAAAAIARLEAGERPAAAPEPFAEPEAVPAFDDDDPFAAYRLDAEPPGESALEPADAAAAADDDDDDAGWENPFLEGAATTAPEAPASAEGADVPAKGEREGGAAAGEDADAEGPGDADERDGNPGEGNAPPPEGTAEARRRGASDDGVDTLFWGET